MPANKQTGQYSMIELLSNMDTTRTIVSIWITFFLAFVTSQVTQVKNPEMYRLHIVSDIAFRFATTNVTSYLANNEDTAKEVQFKVTLPKSAFISNFSMVIDGVLYEGDVKEKQAAQKQYNRAKKRGHSAGQVKAKSPKESNIFKIEVNIAARSKVEFSLTYQELLQRRLGIYEHIINIDPGQVVRDLKVKVSIQESKKITLLKVPELRRAFQNSIELTDNPALDIDKLNNQNAIVTYTPDTAAQLAASSEGIAGQFVVQYDVERELGGGELQVVDGYFVHYFAPSGLAPVAKNVMFVLDVSGSMSGDKISQVKKAMYTILDDLREGDSFNIILFATNLRYWNSDGMVSVNQETVGQAKTFVKNMQASGGTNINEGLTGSVTFLRAQKEKETEYTPSIIIFLTDGQPTSGVTGTEEILQNVRAENQGSSALFSLGFGNDVDFQFLKKVSLQNDGFARKIYLEADPSLQLQNFYEEVSTPVFADVKIKYLDNKVDTDSVTDTAFSTYFQGSELIVAGKLRDDQISNLVTQVSGQASTGYMEMSLSANIARMETKFRRHDFPRFTERLWAYLTIKKLLNTMLQATDSTQIAQAKQKALQLSLKYGFVTPLTSMVVTKPEDEVEEEEELTVVKPTAPPSTTSQRPARTQYSRHSGRQYSSDSSKVSRSHPKNSFVDNDPHFVVRVQGIDEGICFDVNGQPGDIFQLIYDNLNDIVVNGEVNAPDLQPPSMKHVPTYFSQIAIMHSGKSIKIAPRKVTINNKTMTWKAAHATVLNDMVIELTSRHNLLIKIGSNIEFLVLRHLYNLPNPRKMDYLGFYVAKGDGLDQYCHGLIGQFQKANVGLHQPDKNEIKKFVNIQEKVTKTLHLTSPDGSKRSVIAFLGKRRDMELKEHVPCWHIRNNGKGLLHGHFLDYIVPDLYHLNFSFLKNKHKMSVKRAGV